MRIAERRKQLETQAPVSVQEKKSIFDHIHSAKDLRDGLLAGAGTLYIIGYVVWAYNAWIDGLGLLPAVESQYFVAGIPMAVLLVFAFFVNRLTIIAARSILLKGSNNSDLVANAYIVTYFIALTILMWITGQHRSSDYMADPIKATAFCMILVVFAVLTRLFGLFVGDERQGNLTATSFLIVPVLGIGSQFIVHGYRQIPREFGGVKMRYASVLVKRSDLPIKARVALLSPSDYWLPGGVTKPAEDPNPMVQTDTLDVLYEGGDALIVRPHTAHGNGPTYELRRSNIQGIVWYGYEAPKTP